MSTKKKFSVKFIIPIIGLLLCICLPQSDYAQNVHIPTVVPLDMEEHIVKIFLNQQDALHEEYILIKNQAEIYMPLAEIQEWNIYLPEVEPLQLGQYSFYNLSWLDGVEYELNPKEEILYIQIAPDNFSEKIYHQNEFQFQALRPQISGGYINYDLSMQVLPSEDRNDLGAITSLNYFNYYGVGQSDFIIQNNSNYNRFIRLESVWTLDKPESMASWRLGDSITNTDIWTGAVRFGGIQYATNFSTQPGFVTYPLPSFKGEAIVPTGVNFYLDGQLQLAENVSEGPFEIEGLPSVTGAGDVVVQTRDLLGRQTAIVVPYYVTPELLKKGLSDFSYEIGAIRNNYGIDSNDYTHPLAVGGFRKGISDSLTLGWHGELLTDQQTLGAGANYLIEQAGLLSMAGAVSHSHRGNGGLLLLGASRQSQTFSIGAQAIATTHDFTQIGISSHLLSPALIGQFYSSYTTPKFGTLSFTYSQRNGRSESNIGVANLTYNKNIFKNVFFLINVVKDFLNNSNAQLLVSLVWSPASGYTASSNVIHESGSTAPALSFIKNLPVGTGYGYRLLAQQDGDKNTRYAGDYSYQNNLGTYLARYSRYNDSSNYEFDAAGSIVLFAQDVFLARHIDNSFAVVEIPQISDIKVYESNQLIGKTNKKGHLLIPDTRPYEKNQITINLKDIPLNYLVEKDKQTAYPYFRSGVLVEFPVKPLRNINFQLLDNNGQPIAPGTLVYLRTQHGPGIVGFEGKVFIDDYTEASVLTGYVILKQNQHCSFSAKIPESNELYLSLGSISCKISPANLTLASPFSVNFSQNIINKSPFHWNQVYFLPKPFHWLTLSQIQKNELPKPFNSTQTTTLAQNEIPLPFQSA